MATNSVKRWEVTSSTGKHFDVLDGIRGVAILMVVAYHTFYTNPGSGALMRTIGGALGTGWMGVPIFFVLSGFLISYPFFRERTVDGKFWYQRGYTSRRIGKIIPPFYLSIVIFTLYYFLRFSDPAYLHAAWQWAVGLPNFVPPAANFKASYWSLIVEVHFYIILPPLFFFTRGRKPRATTALLFLFLFAVPLVARQLTWPDAPDKEGVQFLMSRFPCDLDFFAWGVLFSGLFVSLSSIRDKVRVLSSFGYVGLALLAISTGLWVFWVPLFDILDHPTRWSVEIFHLLPATSAFLMLFFVFNPACIGARVLGHSSLRFIGIVSYEWFLFHQPVVSLFHDMFGQTRGSLVLYIGKTVLPLALTFGFSVIVYRFFSLPLMNRIRGNTLRNTEPPSPSALDGQPDALAKLPAPR
jgi:peptidoglycan/LPS O-acetylase OafA/YrhL